MAYTQIEDGELVKQAQLWAIGIGQEKEKPNDRFEDNDAHFRLIHNNIKPNLQDTTSSTLTSLSSSITGTRRQKSFGKRILIIDDDPDITLTFKAGLEDNSKEFQVHTYNDPILLLGEFKPNFYDLILIDINLPYLNGFELCQKLLEIDLNVKVCFITAGEINEQGLRELYPNIGMGCFIQKPVTMDYLAKRLLAELE
jgi:CheY-like chemotaxis protein